MEKNKQIDEVLQKMNLKQDANSRLELIASITKTLPILSSLEFVAKHTKDGKAVENNISGTGDEAYVKYILSKTDNVIGLTTEDKRYLVNGLKYYSVEDFKIENLQEKQVTLTYNTRTVYFDKPTVSYTTSITYNFNKKNVLETIDVERKQTSNNKTTLKTESYQKDRVKKMLKSQAKNQSEYEITL